MCLAEIIKNEDYLPQQIFNLEENARSIIHMYVFNIIYRGAKIIATALSPTLFFFVNYKSVPLLGFSIIVLLVLKVHLTILYLKCITISSKVSINCDLNS